MDKMKELGEKMSRPEIGASERRQLGVPDRMTTAEWLDVTWRRLAEEGDDMAQSLDARLQEAAKTFEDALGELRDYARMKLTETQAPKSNPHCPDNKCALDFYHEHNSTSDK